MVITADCTCMVSGFTFGHLDQVFIICEVCQLSFFVDVKVIIRAIIFYYLQTQLLYVVSIVGNTRVFS